jgi:photosystem II stability/assembly factor-like uncharacterized protein
MWLDLAMRTGVAITLFLALALPSGASAHHHRLPQWKPVPTGSDQQYRGLAAVSTKIAWVGGSDGEVLRTSDGGRTWKDVSPPDTKGLLFRDVEAWGTWRASVLAIGEGEASRIYTTFDGGRHWKLAFVNDDPAAFYDCMDFFAGGRRGLVMSDPVGGRFRIAATDDWGLSWHVLPNGGMPDAVGGEAGFAASGTCLVASGSRDAWFGSGGGASRVFHTRDGGFTWKAKPAPIPASAAGGVFSLAFRNTRDGVMVGGDFLVPANGVDASGFTHNGVTWRGGGDLSGYRSGVDWVSGSDDTLIAVGPTGSDVTYDGARSWTAFDGADYDAVDCVRGACWASGPAGAVARTSTPAG